MGEALDPRPRFFFMACEFNVGLLEGLARTVNLQRPALIMGGGAGLDLDARRFVVRTRVVELGAQVVALGDDSGQIGMRRHPRLA